MPVEIVHWNPRRPVIPGRVGRRIPLKRPVNNFGDVLGPALVRRILESRGVSNATQTRTRLLTIGSIMHLAQPGDVVWGTGVNGKSLHRTPPKGLSLRAVRGPETAAFLTQHGYVAPSVFGDPGLLVARYFPELATAPAHRAGTVFVPNLNDIKRDPAMGRSEGLRVINPRQPLYDCIRAIGAAEFVVSSSLHGIVVAEAFGIPARLVASFAEPDFKYVDYFGGTGRSSTGQASTVGEALRLGGHGPAVWDADALMGAFPWELFTGGTA